LPTSPGNNGLRLTRSVNPAVGAVEIGEIGVGVRRETHTVVVQDRIALM
jgi:hypothetical protein